MVMGEKSHKSFSEQMYQKAFNKNDPFDRLIMELEQKGILNVAVVGIGNGSKKHQEYTRRPQPSKGKHSL